MKKRKRSREKPRHAAEQRREGKGKRCGAMPETVHLRREAVGLLSL